MQNEFNRKCYGDIEIAVTDTAYEIRTEKENFSLLNHVVHVKNNASLLFV